MTEGWASLPAADFPACKCPRPDCPLKEPADGAPAGTQDSPVLVALRRRVHEDNARRAEFGDLGRLL